MKDVPRSRLLYKKLKCTFESDTNDEKTVASSSVETKTLEKSIEGSRIFTKNELLEYCEENPEKIIIVDKDDVYDITKFVDEHPDKDAMKIFFTLLQIKKDKFTDIHEVAGDSGLTDDIKKYFFGKISKNSL